MSGTQIKNIKVLDGDGIERTVDTEESKVLLRQSAAQSIVLLRNQGGVLPLNAGQLKKIAVIGSNAKAIVLSGGGSAALKASFFVTPFQGIVNALQASGSDVAVEYCEGARGLWPFSLLEELYRLLHDLSFQNHAIS